MESFKSDEENLLDAIKNKNIEKVKLILENSNINNRVLNLNETNENGNYPLLKAVIKDNVEIVKLLMAYANQHQIVLEMNKRNKGNEYPIFNAIDKDNTAMVKLLIEYATQHQIILNLNEKYIFIMYPLTVAITNDNIEIVKLLINYANQNHFILKYDKTYVKILPNFAFKSKKLIQDYKKEKKREKNEREHMERERLERERLEKERLEREKLEQEKLERERIEKERLEREGKMAPTLVIATNKFDGESHEHLNFIKNEFLIVTNWSYEKKGWVYGHRKDNEEEKGIFPELFIRIYKDENIEKNNMKSEITPEYIIKFENKINQLRALDEMNLIDIVTFVEVNRKNLFNDAFKSIMSKTPQQLKGIIIVSFIGEEGLDVGGLLKEFFYLISKEIGNPKHSLFKYSHDRSYELEINTDFSVMDPTHIEYFRFIGRIIGLAIFNRQYLSVTFSSILNKKLLNKPIEFSDLEYADPQLFKSLKNIKDYEGVEDLYLTFSRDIEDCFGHHQTIELKPNGANIDVTDENKNEYIDLVIKSIFDNANDKEKLNALKKGFYEIIPESINSLLDEIDLKYLISGISIIDVDDWENNTEYRGYNKDDETIKYFWECVRNFSNENRTKLLVFVTSNSQVPVTGFKDLQGGGATRHFTIEKLGTKSNLPISNTCFNRIKLPPYPSVTIMKQKLLHAISEGSDGFALE